MSRAHTISHTTLRRWAVRLTYASIGAHLLAGAVLPLIVDAPLLDGYHRSVETAFFGHATPPAAHALQTWWVALFGPTVQAAALWMAALAWIGDRQRLPFAWGALIAGLLLWAPQDVAISLQANIWAHVWLDGIALAGMLPALLYLFYVDRTKAAAGGGAAQQDADTPAPDFGGNARQFLVTGATGFIGQRLVRALLRNGHRVIVLSRQPRHAAWQFDGRVECVSDIEQLPAARRIDVVINLAGARILGWRWTAARRAALRSSRVGLTRRLVQWIAKAEHKPALMLSASAIGYYGIQRRGDQTALTESAPPQPIFMSDLCREWEDAAQGAASLGVNVATMRFGLVLGTQGALPMMLLPIKLGMGGPLAGGTQWLSWIHVDDLVAGMAHLCRNGASGAYNFTAPETVTQAQFSRTAAGVLRRPYGLPTPGLPMRLLLGEQADLLLEGQRVVPHRLQESGFAFTYPRLADALRSIA